MLKIHNKTSSRTFNVTIKDIKWENGFAEAINSGGNASITYEHANNSRQLNAELLANLYADPDSDPVDEVASDEKFSKMDSERKNSVGDEEYVLILTSLFSELLSELLSSELLLAEKLRFAVGVLPTAEPEVKPEAKSEASGFVVIVWVASVLFLLVLSSSEISFCCCSAFLFMLFVASMLSFEE